MPSMGVRVRYLFYLVANLAVYPVVYLVDRFFLNSSFSVLGLLFWLGTGCGPAHRMIPVSPVSPVPPALAAGPQLPKREPGKDSLMSQSPAMRLGLRVVLADGVSNTQISCIERKMETNESQISIRGHLSVLDRPDKVLFAWSENAFGSPMVQIQVQHRILNGNNLWIYEKSSYLEMYNYRNKEWFVSISDLIRGLTFHETDTHLMILDFLLADQTRYQIDVRFRVRSSPKKDGTHSE